MPRVSHDQLMVTKVMISELYFKPYFYLPFMETVYICASRVIIFLLLLFYMFYTVFKFDSNEPAAQVSS